MSNNKWNWNYEMLHPEVQLWQEFLEEDKARREQYSAQKTAEMKAAYPQTMEEVMATCTLQPNDTWVNNYTGKEVGVYAFVNENGEEEYTVYHPDLRNIPTANVFLGYDDQSFAVPEQQAAFMQASQIASDKFLNDVNAWVKANPEERMGIINQQLTEDENWLANEFRKQYPGMTNEEAKKAAVKMKTSPQKVDTALAFGKIAGAVGAATGNPVGMLTTPVFSAIGQIKSAYELEKEYAQGFITEAEYDAKIKELIVWEMISGALSETVPYSNSGGGIAMETINNLISSVDTNENTTKYFAEQADAGKLGYNYIEEQAWESIKAKQKEIEEQAMQIPKINVNTPTDGSFPALQNQERQSNRKLKDPFLQGFEEIYPSEEEDVESDPFLQGFQEIYPKEKNDRKNKRKSNWF